MHLFISAKCFPPDETTHPNLIRQVKHIFGKFWSMICSVNQEDVLN